jgi:hypothetical protein
MESKGNEVALFLPEQGGMPENRRRIALAVLLLVFGGLAAACRTAGPAPPPPAPAPPGTPLEPEEEKLEEEEALPVEPVQQEIVVAAWAEPARLPPGGGQSQLIVRVQKRGGAPFPGVEVRFRTSKGKLYSGGRVLTTDRGGMTRDRLTTRETTTVTLNAGGTRYRFRIPVAERESE